MRFAQQGTMLDHRPLNGLGEVRPDVPPIRDMDRIGSADPPGLGVGSGTVPADHFDAGMTGEPAGHRRCRPVRQQVDGLACLDVDQDCAVVVSLAQGEIVHPEDSRCRRLGLRQAADQPQQRRPAHPGRQGLGQAGAGPACQHDRDAFKYCLQAGTSSSVPEGQPVDLLSERRLPTGAFAASEPPYL